MNTEPKLSIAQGRFALHSALGEGGMAYVFRCTDSKLKVDRAIKFLAPRLMRHSQIRERFESEASTMAQLNHPNIVQIFDIGNERSLVYMVMELLVGGSVQDRIERHGPLEPRQAVDVAIGMARGLGFAHQNKVIHRDVKLDNVLIANDGTPKVADFGIARVNDGRSGMTMTGAVMGTLAYMAPEQRLSARRAGPQADLYAVAASLYVMLTGENPSELFNEEIQERAFSDLSDPITEFLTQGCHFSPDKRFADSEDMIEALETMKAQLPPLSVESKALFIAQSANEQPRPSADRQRTETLNTMWTSLIGEDTTGAFEREEVHQNATLDGMSFLAAGQNGADLHTMDTLIPEGFEAVTNANETLFPDATVPTAIDHGGPPQDPLAVLTAAARRQADSAPKPEQQSTVSPEKKNHLPLIAVSLVAVIALAGLWLQEPAQPTVPPSAQPAPINAETVDSESPKQNKNTTATARDLPAESIKDKEIKEIKTKQPVLEASAPTKAIKAQPKKAKNPKKPPPKGPAVKFVISSIPSGPISINGETKGSPFVGSLPAGSYQVRYQPNGFPASTKQVTIKNNGSTKVCYNFNINGPCSDDF